MHRDDCFTPDATEDPYWWDAARPEPVTPADDRRAADVAIVGSGFTGLAAALVLLRGGRSVLLFEAEEPGFGASRRNAGYLGRTLKKSFSSLRERHGDTYALRVYRELNDALQTVRRLVVAEGIDCHLDQCGRFIGATSPAHYEDLARECELMYRHLGFPHEMVPRREQHREVASDVYHGGAVIPDLGSLHPGLYHKGLLARVVAAGGIVRARTAVLGIVPAAADGRARLQTTGGEFTARDVIVATNGYTGPALPWHARRVIPFAGYMAATEPMSRTLLDKLIPQRRTVIESTMDINYVRPAPDSPRLLFGGLTGRRTPSLRHMGQRLRDVLGRILPDAAPLRLTHVWTGQCAGTFDFMPHVGGGDGVWYAMGYNFAGVPMGTYLGTKVGQKILGRAEGETVFAAGRFPTMPLYRGTPWFVPAAMRYFGWQDRRMARRRTGRPGPLPDRGGAAD